ncbi:MAG: septal ring lytic transglycosylase RlpA family protein [Steroidobacteraceae bacterium]
MRIVLLFVLIVIAGCTPLRPKSTPPAPSAKEVASIPDAVPREEPRGKYGNPESYVVFGKRYRVMKSGRGHVERGVASWYGPGFHSERTSSGEPYDMYAMTAAHKTLPIPSYVRVTHLENGRSIVVRVNDRGPFVGDRIIDLSYTAARKLDMVGSGTAPVEIRVLEPGERTNSSSVRMADNAAGQSERNPRIWRADAIPSPRTLAAAIDDTALPPVLAASTAAVPASLTEVTISSSFLQAGAFSTRDNAEAMRGRLASAGISNALVREVRIGERTLYRVQVGPVDGEIEADDMIERLRIAGVPDARPAHE